MNKEEEAMKIFYIPLAFCGALIGGLLMQRQSGPSSEPPRASEEPVEPEFDPDITVKAWLESQRKGRDGFEFWMKDDFVRRFSLYAVSEYEIVDAPNSLERVVRIHHATRGGTPVVSLFKVCILREGILKIDRQGDEK